jgi:hypothetical protein
MVRADLLRSGEAHRGDQALRLGDGRVLVVVDPFGLVRDVERAAALGILGGDADRALVGVAAL